MSNTERDTPPRARAEAVDAGPQCAQLPGQATALGLVDVTRAGTGTKRAAGVAPRESDEPPE